MQRLQREARRAKASRVSRFEAVLTPVGNALLPISLVLVLMGIAALCLASVGGQWRYPTILPTTWSLQHWSAALSSWQTPLFNAIAIALLSVTAAIVLSLVTLEAQARSRAGTASLSTFLYLPLLIPQVVFISGIAVFAERTRLPPSLLLDCRWSLFLRDALCVFNLAERLCAVGFAFGCCWRKRLAHQELFALARLDSSDGTQLITAYARLND